MPLLILAAAFWVAAFLDLGASAGRRTIYAQRPELCSIATVNEKVGHLLAHTRRA